MIKLIILSCVAAFIYISYYSGIRKLKFMRRLLYRFAEKEFCQEINFCCYEKAIRGIISIDQQRAIYKSIFIVDGYGALQKEIRKDRAVIHSIKVVEYPFSDIEEYEHRLLNKMEEQLQLNH